MFRISIEVELRKDTMRALADQAAVLGWKPRDVAEEVLRSWAEGLAELPAHPARGRTSGQPPLVSSAGGDTIRGGSKSRKGK